MTSALARNEDYPMLLRTLDAQGSRFSFLEATSYGSTDVQVEAATGTTVDDTFAHELGHILTDAGHRNADASGADDRLTDTELQTIKSSLFGWTVDQCRV